MNEERSFPSWQDLIKAAGLGAGAVLVMLVIVLFISLVTAGVFWFAWNISIATLFGLHINYIESIGAVILLWISGSFFRK